MTDPVIESCVEYMVALLNGVREMQRYEFYDKCAKHGCDGKAIQFILEGEYNLCVERVDPEEGQLNGDIFTLKGFDEEYKRSRLRKP